ncbi:hypothetical protein G3R49_13205 [Shewanella sp. WXL01]|uniref:DNA-binding protein n=1 Tax=Shewanella maritima TaxID=2520507 RepID=A0A411PM46_9GAMM|nr:MULTISPECIES: hypothetical protein [Shewanella]NKF51515.1 hypothetical protein [Shewanella sp. WXL01]QBF84558.1 hypothetical protein EXU30_19200 [Shewanella maritima]
MTALSKEEVISALSAALEKQSGKAVSIEQSGSWYKIDGGKSVRFSELEKMLAEFDGGEAPVQAEETKAEPVKKEVKAKPAKKAAAKSEKKKPATSANGGLTPKQLWRQKLANAGKNTLPRGF